MKTTYNSGAKNKHKKWSYGKRATKMQNNEELRQNEGPIHSAFLHVLPFHEAAQRSIRHKMLSASWRHLVDFGCHCNVGATADIF